MGGVNRRISTLVVALVPILIFGMLLTMVTVPYVALGPGPTFDTLGEVEGKQVVELEAVKASFKERKDGSRDRAAISKAWATTLAYVRELGVVREVPFGGRRYLEKLAL